MSGPTVLLIVIGILILLMVLRVPMAIAFLGANLVGIYLLVGGQAGLLEVPRALFRSTATFSLLPIPLFILMGEVMYRSGMAVRMIEAVDNMLGALPGRLAILTVLSGALLSTLTGASTASVAMLGSTLLPEMEKRGYKPAMTLSPILGSGGLAIMIPPSGLAVLLGAIAGISIGGLLLAIVIPGAIMTLVYGTYIVVRCSLDPALAPTYESVRVDRIEQLRLVVKYVIPLSLIVFLVIGLIVLGVVTPTESAAFGAIGTFGLAAAYKGLNLRVISDSLTSTVKISVMILFLIAASSGFGQVLAFSGIAGSVGQELAESTINPLVLVIFMQLVVLALGSFLNVVVVLMITMPLFMPVVGVLGFDPLWFGVLTLLNVEMGTVTPPFGLSLFALKAVVGDHISMPVIFRAAVPFLLLDGIVMILILFVPSFALWLPSLA